MRKHWRFVDVVVYLRDMGRHRSSRRLGRVRQPSDLRTYAGSWVAIKDGQVVAAAPTSLDLVAEVKKLGVAGESSVAQYVAPHDDAIIIGVG